MENQDFSATVRKIKALDNEIKMSIFVFLVENGSKSITDVSKAFKLNFSTTHKYLEEMEKAGILESKETVKNRLKRMFFVRDFHIDLSPKGLTSTKRKGAKGKFKIITSEGFEDDFDWDIFIKPYLEIGIPKNVIDTATKQIENQAYDGITTLELRNLLRNILKSRVRTLIESLENIKKEFKRRSYAHNLAISYPESLKYHMAGSLFIKNLGIPQYFSYMYDLRGIAIHGVDGVLAKNTTEFLEQIKFASEKINKCSRPFFGMDSVNYIFAPFLGKKSEKSEISKILSKINSLGGKFFLGVDVGVPRFAKDLSVQYFTTKKKETYADYQKLAQEIAIDFLKAYSENEYENIRLIIKFWDTKSNVDLSLINKPFYIANLNPAWQTSNASYIGDHERLDCSWKQWMKTVRTGEVQKIALNLPRIALESKNMDDFLKNLIEAMDFLEKIYVEMVEQTLGEFLKHKETILKSTESERWSFASAKDALYSISVVGLNEAVQILTGKTLDKNVVVGEKILVAMNERIKHIKFPIRVALKEEKDPLIIKRFYSLDKKEYSDEMKFKKYSPGISCPDCSKEFSLHKYLLGGHSGTIKNSKTCIKDFIKSDGGLVKVLPK